MRSIPTLFQKFLVKYTYNFVTITRESDVMVIGSTLLNGDINGFLFSWDLQVVVLFSLTLTVGADTSLRADETWGELDDLLDHTSTLTFGTLGSWLALAFNDLTDLLSLIFQLLCLSRIKLFKGDRDLFDHLLDLSFLLLAATSSSATTKHGENITES